MQPILGAVLVLLGVFLFVRTQRRAHAEAEVMTVLSATQQWKDALQIHKQIWTNRIQVALEAIPVLPELDLFVQFSHLEPDPYIMGVALMSLELRHQIESRSNSGGVADREWRVIMGYDHRKKSRRRRILPAFDWSFGRPVPLPV